MFNRLSDKFTVNIESSHNCIC